METEHREGRREEGCAYSMEQPYGCTLHGVTVELAALSSGCVGLHVAGLVLHVPGYG